MKEYADTRMHTAEHILNQTMVRLFNKGRAFSSHIEKKKSKCDYHFDRDLTPPGSGGNTAARKRSDCRRTAPWPRSSCPAKGRPSVLTSPACLRARRPTPLRVITVGDYDSCPCIGQHVSNTREIGIFRIASTNHENGVLRVRFRLDEAA